jgi:replication factor C small subunit
MKIEEVWVEKYRPKKLEDIIMSDENRRYFSGLQSVANNYLFVGKCGTGKNTLAYYLRDKFAPASYLYINASSESGIETVRNKITDFVSTTSWDGNPKLVILSEFDGFSRQGQQALREIMEQYLSDVRFILTGNYGHNIITEIKSRCQSFDFTPDLKSILKRVVYILEQEGIAWKDHTTQIKQIVKTNAPDVRKTINEIQKCCLGGKFVDLPIANNELGQEIWKMVGQKTHPFEIRKYVIEHEQDFNSDYMGLMRNLFDMTVKDGKLDACLTVVNRMSEHQKGLDPEINFTGLLLELNKL